MNKTGKKTLNFLYIVLRKTIDSLRHRSAHARQCLKTSQPRKSLLIMVKMLFQFTNIENHLTLIKQLLPMMTKI